MPNSEDEVNEVDTIEEEIGTKEESLISFWHSGLNEELSRGGQPNVRNVLLLWEEEHESK